MSIANPLIAGTGRADSTPLCHYLVAQPRICASSIKETKIFVRDQDGANADDLSAYETYCARSDIGHLIRLEATLAYLHRGITMALKIAKTLASMRSVFRSRDPTCRLYSNYRNRRAIEPRIFGRSKFTDFSGMAIERERRATERRDVLSANNEHDRRAGWILRTSHCATRLEEFHRLFPAGTKPVRFFEDLVRGRRTLTQSRGNFFPSFVISAVASILRSKSKQAHINRLGGTVLPPTSNENTKVQSIRARIWLDWRGGYTERLTIWRALGPGSIGARGLHSSSNITVLTMSGGVAC